MIAKDTSTMPSWNIIGSLAIDSLVIEERFNKVPN